MYGILMRNSGRRVEREWQGSVSEGKRRRIGASETNEETKTRRGIRGHTKTERISPKPDRPESNDADPSKGRRGDVELDVHGTSRSGALLWRPPTNKTVC